MHRARDLEDRSVNVRDLEIAIHVSDDRPVEVNTHVCVYCEDRACRTRAWSVGDGPRGEGQSARTA
jgi:hypothetical protein